MNCLMEYDLKENYRDQYFYLFLQTISFWLLLGGPVGDQQNGWKRQMNLKKNMIELTDENDIQLILQLTLEELYDYCIY